MCVHEVDPTYCALPATSAVVINELMLAPGPVDNALGEWFESYNTSDAFIDLEGWVIETHIRARATS